MSNPNQRLVDGLAMLQEMRPHVRESGEQKFAAAMIELQGALEGFIEAAKTVKPVPPASLAEVADTATKTLNGLSALGDRYEQLIAEAREHAAALAADAARRLPGLPQ